MYWESFWISVIFVCLVVSTYVSSTAHFPIQWYIVIGKGLSQVNKNINLANFKGKQLKWRCHSHQKTAVELKITNQRQVTMYFKVTTSNYLPHDSILQGLKTTQNSLTRNAHDKTMISMWTNPTVIFRLGWCSNHKLNVSCYFVPVFYWEVKVFFLF